MIVQRSKIENTLVRARNTTSSYKIVFVERTVGERDDEGE
jgi:hypothetical protein